MKYKIGDRVKVKSLDWYNKSKDENDRIKCGIDSFIPDMAEYCGREAIIKGIIHNEYEINIDNGCWSWTDDMFEEIMGDEISFDTKYEWKNELECPDGYQFVDENGNVINATKIVLEKKKKEYPKTFRECCEIIGLCSDTLKWSNPFCINRDTHPYIKHLDNLMERFCKLFICRNAYWKIAGEQMGLGKAWEPYWTIYEHKFCIGTNKNKVVKECLTIGNRILAFPTEEMRDAFYENFKELIEQCKELL